VSEAVVNMTGGLHPIADAADVSRRVLGPPPDWTGTDAPTHGAVLIPDHVDPTNPRRVYELEDRAECKYLYEIVLTDGTCADINRFFGLALLVDLWDGLYLPHDVRVAWAPKIAPANGRGAPLPATTPPLNSKPTPRQPAPGSTARSEHQRTRAPAPHDVGCDNAACGS